MFSAAGTCGGRELTICRAKMRADAAAMKKAAEEEEAKAETTTTRPESKHDSMDPQREVVNAIRSTKTTEVKKKRWFRRIF
jgi:hypothetical protein